MSAVTLEIKVKDGEVKQAEVSLKRLDQAANNVGRSGSSSGLSQQEKLARFMGKDMPAAAKQATAATEEVAASAAAAGEGFAGMAASGSTAIPVIGAIVIALTAFVVVTAVLAKQIFDLARGFAGYANEVGRMAEETGLAVETAAALKHELEAQGRSVNELNGPLSNFRKLIGEAAAGSEDARKKLNLLGVDGSKAIYDVDSAFKTAVANIVKAPTAMQQVVLAFNAFGDDGYKLIPFLKEFHGNVDLAVAKARELGIEIGGKDVQSAREFNRAYEDLKKVVIGIAYTFGREFLPGVTAALKGVAEWVISNKDTIKSWAVTVGDWVTFLIEKWQTFLGIVNGVASALALVTRTPMPSFVGASGPGAQPGAPNYDPNLNPIPDLSKSPDAAALDALRAEAEKLRQEREKAAQAELAAQIQLYENSASQLGKTYDDAFKKITERLKETLDIGQYEADWQQLKAWYGDNINDLVPKWEELVKRQTAASKKGVNEQYLVKTEFDKRVEDLTGKTNEHDAAAAKAVADIKKKLTADQLKDYEAAMNRRIELDDSSTKTRIAQAERDFQITIISEREKVDLVNKLELDSLEKRKTEAKKFLEQVVGNKDKEAEASQRIKLLDEQIAQQKITNSNRVLDVMTKEQKRVEDIRKAYEGYKQSLEDQIDALSRGNRPLTIYEQTMRDLERDYKDLEPAQKRQLLDLAAQADAVEALNKQHAELKGFFSETLSYAFDGDFSGLLKSFARRAKEALIDQLSGALASSILGFDPNATSNPVAKPIVNKITKTNEILNAILVRLGGSPVATGLGGLAGLSGLGSGSTGGGLGTIFGGNAGGGIFNFGGGNGSPITSGDALNWVSQGVNQSGSGSGSQGGGANSILSNIRNTFSTNPGGIFAPVNGSSMAGYLSGAGSLASLIGGMIPGRAGSTISGAGMGLQIGAMFGPWGAVIGAGVGALIGFLGFSDPKRKRDKNEKLPQLAKGFTDAFAELNKILADLRALRMDPDEAVSRAMSVRNDIASGFGIQFESKKYRKQSQKQIAENLTRADPIVEQIKAAAAIARGAADRSKRILPEFAGGTYFADYFKPNGLLPGMFDGRDNIMAMISRGEMVLNPTQQGRIRALAGGDVFAHAGIPNYPRASRSSALAGGGIAGNGLALPGASPVMIQPRFTVILDGVIFESKAQAWIESDDGVRTLAKVVKKEKITA